MDSKTAAQKAINLLDLTSLNDDDTDEIIAGLCDRAKTEFGNTAAVCVYPRFVPAARKQLRLIGAEDISIATVSNFPHGNDYIESAVAETKASVAYGADEVDTVFPYKKLLLGNKDAGKRQIDACRKACGNTAKLKVIIESGELKEPDLIREASRISIECGADFIKTSTGKVPVNATVESARVMMEVIRDLGNTCGMKVAGGVKTTDNAAEYLELASEVLGPGALQAHRFRFGASGVLSALVATLKGEQADAISGY
ncbi:deoxyribose-phosphate aldolase [Puniceicoccaceae bacterium K14]|nr:deoxyribose-phosphate aldolase [Puniceicoccaceae bacterium K14]